MDWDGERFAFAPTDLTTHLGCAHASALARAYRRGKGAAPRPPGPYAQLIFAKGDDHEAAYRDDLEAAGRQVAEAAQTNDWARDAESTARLMREGADVIYQAVFVRGDWRGRADFVERLDGESDLGSWSYEAVDTKLARETAKPSHALQLCFYSDGIAAIQGHAPRLAHIVLGSGRRESIRVGEIGAYFRRAQRSLVRAAAEEHPTEPYPCEACTYCGYRQQCEGWWLDTDHLSRVAGIHHGQVRRLVEAGVRSRGELAVLAADVKVPQLPARTLARLRRQARLQVAADTAPAIPYELEPVMAGVGLARLPPPSPGDVMFDIEGDPYFTAAQDLTFLFGLLLRDGEEWRYQAIWAHDPAGERQAFERLVDLLVDRLAAHPDLHVYHYSPAEISVVNRLVMRHATREVEVDGLLRGGALCDLFGIVRQALRAGVESYGLKQIERLAGFRRTGGLGSGADAVLGYEAWMASRQQELLDGIAAYNEEDCRATLALRDWLVGLRPAEIPEPDAAPQTPRPEAAIEAERRRQALHDELVADAAPGSQAWLAGELLHYHQREGRPGWWRWFSLFEMTPEELVDEAGALGGLEPLGPPQPVARKNWERRLRFPEQRHKIAPGDDVVTETDRGVTVAELDEEHRTVTLRARLLEHECPTALFGDRPFNTNAQREALCRVAQAVRDRSGAHPALADVLARALPRFRDREAGDDIQTTLLAEQRALARSLDRSYLLVQGPPGTGKTWTGARLITELAARGQRVGVTALSHQAINNLLTATEQAALEETRPFRGIRKAAKHGPGWLDGIGFIENSDDDAEIVAGGHDVVAGTTWLFAKPIWDEPLDYLVIDEAGQMSLADALAAGTAARNLILLGDPLQLPQVSQASHPPGTNASVLEHLLGEAVTVPPDRGLFLEESRRMHPDICRFISAQVYDGRLRWYPACEAQGTGVGTGIRYLPVAHAGNESRSPEEARAIRDLIDGLVGVDLTDMQGIPRALRPDDVMVVAPYNAQVRLLRETLQDGVRVGTVDRFQGQEAPVVIFSMATSAGEDIPRDIGFLFSRNRLNVAISRARCLAVLCCSPDLLDTQAHSIEDMRLISTLCALVETAQPSTR